MGCRLLALCCPGRGESPARACTSAVVRQRRGADLDPARLQPGCVPRQGRRPERLSPVAARLRPGMGSSMDHARVSSAGASAPPIPEESLLLRKPAGLAPHEGGKLFGAGSRAYQVLLDWIRAGAPGQTRTIPAQDARDLRRSPASLRPGQEQQLQVRAGYSDGSNARRDLAEPFDSNDAGMAGVDAQGLVNVLRHGETRCASAFRARSRSSS